MQKKKNQLHFSEGQIHGIVRKVYNIRLNCQQLNTKSGHLLAVFIMNKLFHFLKAQFCPFKMGIVILQCSLLQEVISIIHTWWVLLNDCNISCIFLPPLLQLFCFCYVLAISVLCCAHLHEVFPWCLRFSWRDLYSFSFYCFPLFLCIVYLRTLSYLYLLVAKTLHSVGYILPFLFCISHLFSHLFSFMFLSLLSLFEDSSK